LVEKQSRKNEFLAPTSTSPWAHRVYNIVVRNWNILIFVGHLERPCIYRHTWDLLCGWDRF